MPPTIVLVHGAFAESAGWDRVIDPLLSAGQPVIAAASGPVVLVGHSYVRRGHLERRRPSARARPRGWPRRSGPSPKRR